MLNNLKLRIIKLMQLKQKINTCLYMSDDTIEAILNSINKEIQQTQSTINAMKSIKVLDKMTV